MTDKELKSFAEFLKEQLTNINARLSSIETKQQEFTNRFIEIDTKKKIVDFFVKNWWKLLAVIMPLLVMFGEIALYLRKIF